MNLSYFGLHFYKGCKCIRWKFKHSRNSGWEQKNSLTTGSRAGINYPTSSELAQNHNRFILKLFAALPP